MIKKQALLEFFLLTTKHQNCKLNLRKTKQQITPNYDVNRKTKLECGMILSNWKDNASAIDALNIQLWIAKFRDTDYRSFFKRFYLFIFRERGREGERERNINVWLTLAHLLLWTWPTTQACALTRNPTSDPSVCRLALNPLSHTSQGYRSFFKDPIILHVIQWKYLHIYKYLIAF